MKHDALATVLLAGLATLGVDSVAFAQAATTNGAASDALEEVVVTGSRVITNGNNSPTPVTVVTAQDILKLQPTTISDALNLLPVFSGSNSQVSNPNTGIGSGGGGNGARSALNLRNLDPVRTLVLLDGKRIPPTTSSGVADTDMIPQFLLKRVDVVTGGASAVYGSDAITGVVNFVTDRAFNGVKFSMQGGQSEKHDDSQFSTGIAVGTNLGSKAHIEGSYEYRNDAGILNRSSRPGIWLQTVQGNGTTVPYFLTDNSRRSDVTFGGKINSGALINQQFVAPGVLAPFVNGITTTGNASTQIGGDGAYVDASLKAPLRSHQLFGRLDYDFTDTTHAYLEIAANRKRNQIYAGWPSLANVTISSTNAFLPANIRALIPAAQPTFTFGKYIDTAPRTVQVIDESQIVYQAGLEGELGKYHWDVGYNHGDAKLDNTQYGNVNAQNLSAALDAVTDTSGNVVCRVTVTNPGAFPGCVPLNVFGRGAESAAALNYIQGNPRYVATTAQDDATASIDGTPFNTWAGPFKAALSAEWRTQSFSSVSGMPAADPNVPLNCAGLGLRFNCLATDSIYQNSFGNRSKVSQNVSEGAVEFDAPLLVNQPGFKSLDFNGAVRYTKYNTSGNYTTWKAGIDWHMNDSWRLRATRSRDIRAPTLDDLYAPPVGVPQNVQDLLLGATSRAIRIQTGNPNVKAELGNTTTLGLVYQPESLPGFSASLDAFDIRIDNAIQSLQGTNQQYQNACYKSGGTSIYCTLQTRALGNFTNTPANVVTQWAVTVVNIASIRTSGADLELNYATHLASHPLTLRTMVTYQPHILYVLPDVAILDQGGQSYGGGGLQASPKTRVTLIVDYGLSDNLSVDLLTRWRSQLGLSGDPTVAVSGQRTPSVSYSNLTFNYRVPRDKGKLDLFLNVQNLFNAPAPAANYYGTQTSIGNFGGFAIGDDVVGRYYALGLRYQL